jgi:DegV family protein with EDD domain
MIHIIIDSTAAVPPDMLQAHPNIHVIPLTLSFGEEYVPETESSLEKVIDFTERTGENIKTSQPSTGDFLRLFGTVPKDDGIIVIAITSGVSGTYNGAVLAARQSGRSQITVVNSRTTAVGMVQLLEDVLEDIENGLSFEDISDRLNKAALRMRTTFVPGTLEYLRRGGRIGKAAGLIGSILNIRPVIFLNEKDEVDVLAKVRTEKKGFARMLQFLQENAPCRRIGIVHIENPEGAKALQDQVQKLYPGQTVTVSTGTPVLAAYLGPGLAGIIFEKAE